MNAPMPRAPRRVVRRVGARHARGSRRRRCRCETHALVPLSTQSSPSRTACVRSDAASEPASGSESANAPSISPRAIGCRKRSLCSVDAVAAGSSASAASCARSSAPRPTRRRRRSPRARRGTCSVSSPRPSYSSGISMPRNPSSAELGARCERSKCASRSHSRRMRRELVAREVARERAESRAVLR